VNPKLHSKAGELTASQQRARTSPKQPIDPPGLCFSVDLKLGGSGEKGEQAMIIRRVDFPSFILDLSAAQMKEIAAAELSLLNIWTW
jgi:hypothetical protein